MDCLITVDAGARQLRISVAGRLSLETLPDFVVACAEAAGRPLEIDLSETMSVDRAAAAELRRLRCDGATLTRVPPYIEMVLAGAAEGR